MKAFKHSNDESILMMPIYLGIHQAVPYVESIIGSLRKKPLFSFIVFEPRRGLLMKYLIR